MSTTASFAQTRSRAEQEMRLLLRASLTAAAAVLAASVASAGVNERRAPPPTSSEYEPDVRMLTAANFTQHISKGAWFINFCIVTSQHCQSFKPVWAELQKQKDFLSTSYPDAPFTLAKIDCLVDPDFCGKQGVTSTPDLALYIDGVRQTELFQGTTREYVQLSDWIEDHARKYRKLKHVDDVAPTQQQPSGVTLPPPPPPPAQLQPQLGPQPPKAGAASPPPPAPVKAGPQGPNPEGQVIKYGTPALPDLAALEGFLGEKAGQAMAPAYEKLAVELKGAVNVLEVDCERYSNVCERYAVSQYPTLKMFNAGEVTEYLGGRNLEAMRSWARKAGSTSGVKVVDTIKELDDIIHKHQVVFLYLVEPGVQREETRLVEKASRALLTTPAQFLQTSSSELLHHFAQYLLSTNPTDGDSTTSKISTRSAILVFKDRSSARPIKSLNPGRLGYALSHAPKAGKGKKVPSVLVGLQPGAADGGGMSDAVRAQLSLQIVDWLNANRYPTLNEITGTNFGDVIHNKQGALVVLAGLSDIRHAGVISATGSGAHLRDLEEEALLKLAQRWRTEQDAHSSGGGDQNAAVDGEVVGALIGGKKVVSSSKARSRRVIWAWIDADRWARAIREYYGIIPQDLPSLLLVDGPRLEYFHLPHVTTAVDGKSWLDVDVSASKKGGSTSLTPGGPTHPVFEAIYEAMRGELKAKSSRTYVDRSVRGAEETFTTIADWSVRHPFFSFLFTVAVLSLLVSYMRAMQAGAGAGLGRGGLSGPGSWARRIAGAMGSGGATLPQHYRKQDD
ncbi:hypothetical protein OC861_003807 [Tilletia horrida]|nr:hypothetical protein OC861_003807 [Tilletia horrida]